ncbi:MAG: transposase [bacterium]
MTEQIYYRWRKKYDGFSTGQAKRFKDLKKKISRLKHLVADLSLENVVLKDFASRNL